MKREHIHKKFKTETEDLSAPFLSRAKVPWEKSKEKVWEDLAARLDEVPSRSFAGYLPARKRWLALAASLALLLALSGFLRFYSHKTYCPVDEQANVVLPDGSEVELNARSSLSFHPYWWRFSRKVKLEGEAFFLVNDGRKFSVISTLAVTEVLGTSFTIHSRSQKFHVTCHTGTVRIYSRSSRENVTISQQQQAEITSEGVFTISNAGGTPSLPAWRDNLIMFTSTPLRLVLDEVERQYGIIIESPATMDFVYSGNFALDTPIDDVLTLICRPFDLKYDHKKGTTYRISPIQMD